MTRQVTVYTRADCSLCAKAEVEVARICDELGHGWSAVDIDWIRSCAPSTATGSRSS